MIRGAILFAIHLLDSSDAFLIAPHAPQLHVKRPVHARAEVRAALGDNVRAVTAAAMCSAVLFMSPMAASAKGGGHGGGGGHSGGGGGHSSSYHSSSSSTEYSRRTLNTKTYQRASSSYTGRSSSSSRSRRARYAGYDSSSGYSSTVTAGSSPPPPPLLFPDEATARRENGYFCPSTMPKPGEKVDVDGGVGGRTRSATVISSQAALQDSLYPQATGGASMLKRTPGFENTDCAVYVRYDDDQTTATVSAAEKAQPLLVKYADLFLLVPYAGLILLSPGPTSSSSESAWTRADERHEEVLEALAASFDSAGADDAPASGEYWGASDESDEGDQAVRTTLKFHRGGKVTGRGVDGVDGAYRVTRGRWGKLDTDGERSRSIAWVEVYDEGFKVAVEGKYFTSNGMIKGRFVSSRGVRGTFDLSMKPSVF